MNDSTLMAVLAIMITLMFWSTLVAMYLVGLPSGESQIALIMIGSLGTTWGHCIGYYFGSSRGGNSSEDPPADKKKSQDTQKGQAHELGITQKAG